MARHLVRIFADVRGKRIELVRRGPWRERFVVLPGNEPVRFTATHPMFVPGPNRASVSRVQRGGIVRLAFARAPLLRFSSPHEVVKCVVRLYAPGKYEIHFCLGLLNREIKGDVMQARSDFSAFLNKADRERYPKEIKLVETWMKRTATKPDGDAYNMCSH